ncbi:MAG: hypothetical protein Unbinned5350contig1001_49 [Prokaryotic dsDNA virus sp.]|nr:MAG: hypothetical protein Unbinned5350contig1001_49 [Prokaryotic dsDNA virus sp.]
MDSKNKITLFCPGIGEREFDLKHGMRLVEMKNNGGWVLAEKKEEGIKPVFKKKIK